MTYNQQQALNYTAKMLAATSQGQDRPTIEGLFEYFYARIKGIAEPSTSFKMTTTIREQVRQEILDALNEHGITWKTNE